MNLSDGNHLTALEAYIYTRKFQRENNNTKKDSTHHLGEDGMMGKYTLAAINMKKEGELLKGASNEKGTRWKK